MNNQDELVAYIKISRSLFKHFLWNEKRAFSRFEAWLDLIRKASFSEEVTEMIKGKIISKNKGQIIASVRYLMEAWGWSNSKVSDFLELLRSQQMISIEKQNGISVITLTNYEKHSGKNLQKRRKGDGSVDEESYGYINEEDNEKTQKATLKRQSGDGETTNIIKDNKEEGIRKRNNLSASIEADRVKDKGLKKKYTELCESFANKDTISIWSDLKNFIEENKPQFPEPYIDTWNIFAIRYKLIDRQIELTADRRQKLRTRLAESSFDFFGILSAIRERPAMRGENSSGWKVDFNYLIRSEKTYSEILEGKFK